jgi:beta-fructofuranosidase
MVCGGNVSQQRWGGGAQVQLYRAENDELTNWKHLGPVFAYREREVINIECPNLFQLDGKWVLIVSPHKPCEYFIGSLDLARTRFVPEVHGVLDAGNDYASNISRDASGRTILWLWARTDTPAAKGWNSVMTIPRILSIGPDGFLRQRPAPEFEKLRGDALAGVTVPLTSSRSALRGARGDCLELEVEVAMGKAGAVHLELRCSEAGKAGATITLNGEGLLSIGRASTLLGKNERHRLRIFLDKRVVEVYANDGAAALYGTIDAGRDDLGIAASARGDGAELKVVRAWQMKAAAFDPGPFRA